MAVPIQTQGVQLALTLRRKQRRTPPLAHPPHLLPHPLCPICAGPTARHGDRVACAVCGYGVAERPRRRRRGRARR